jgi:hypothetical protein
LCRHADRGRVRFALATCYDNRFPDIAGSAAADGCALYLASSALDEDNDSFEKVYPVRARDFGLYVVLANLVGPSEAGPCTGRSGVWGPQGERIADAGSDREGFALAEVGRRDRRVSHPLGCLWKVRGAGWALVAVDGPPCGAGCYRKTRRPLMPRRVRPSIDGHKIASGLR